MWISLEIGMWRHVFLSGMPLTRREAAEELSAGILAWGPSFLAMWWFYKIMTKSEALRWPQFVLLFGLYVLIWLWPVAFFVWILATQGGWPCC